MITKAKITIANGTIELEGEETFVRSYLDEYKSLLLAGGVVGAQKVATNMPAKADKNAGRATEKKSAGKKKAVKISAERFEIHGEGEIPSLEDFIKQKSPGRSNAEKMAVIGYYIQELLGQESFSEGQIEYAYKMLGYNRPGHLHQIMINAKNEKDWFEPLEEHGSWVLTRSGDIFVADQLPTKE